MIELRTFDGSPVIRHRFNVLFDEPGFVSFIVDCEGTPQAMVYRGLDTSENNEPVGAYDGTLPVNRNWQSEGDFLKTISDALVYAREELAARNVNSHPLDAAFEALDNSVRNETVNVQEFVDFLFSTRPDTMADFLAEYKETR